MSYQQLVFLDTEFTGLGPDGELISLALVLDEQTFIYLERKDFDIRACSPFVVAAVLPLFGRYPEAICPQNQFGARIRAWAATLPGTAVVAYDHGMDWAFLSGVLCDGFPDQLHIKGLDLSHWMSAPGFEEARAVWHEAPGHEYHHALNDALALRRAYLSTRARLRAGGGDD